MKTLAGSKKSTNFKYCVLQVYIFCHKNIILHNNMLQPHTHVFCMSQEYLVEIQPCRFLAHFLKNLSRLYYKSSRVGTWFISLRICIENNSTYQESSLVGSWLISLRIYIEFDLKGFLAQVPWVPGLGSAGSWLRFLRFLAQVPWVPGLGSLIPLEAKVLWSHPQTKELLSKTKHVQ